MLMARRADGTGSTTVALHHLVSPVWGSPAEPGWYFNRVSPSFHMIISISAFDRFESEFTLDLKWFVFLDNRFEYQQKRMNFVIEDY
ncbi:hypothetical protein BTVI_05322 [Pitangus sulphuratus]|nr:hypothetical protein BTVI_05322 [Pitangus sulphuratus]